MYCKLGKNECDCCRRCGDTIDARRRFRKAAYDEDYAHELYHFERDMSVTMKYSSKNNKGGVA